MPHLDRDAKNAYQRAYREAHREEMRAWHRAYRAERREEYNAYQRAWRAAHAPVPMERYRQTRDELNAYNRQRSRRLRTEMIAAYGGQCACCGETTYEFLALDHRNGDGNQMRKAGERAETLTRRLKREGWPQDNHRLLCHNCNMAYGFYGRCPHQG